MTRLKHNISQKHAPATAKAGLKKLPTLSAIAVALQAKALSERGYAIGGIKKERELTPDEQEYENRMSQTRIAKALAKRERKAQDLKARGL